MRIKQTRPDGYFIVLLGMSILFHYLLPLSKAIPYPYSLTGILLIIVGILITFVTNVLLLKNRTSVKPFQIPRVFITSGPFKFSRNPIYLGMAIALLGAAVILGSFSPLIFPILFVIIINTLVIPMEEHDLEKLFGEQYLNYKAKVRRWI